MPQIKAGALRTDAPYPPTLTAYLVSDSFFV